MTDKEPDMTGRNWVPLVEPVFADIDDEIKQARADKDGYYLEWLESKKARGFTRIVVNF